MCLVSLNWLEPKKKQKLTWTCFPLAWFLKNLWGSFRSASGRQHTYRIRFPWSARPKWLPSLSLVAPNKFWPGFTFPKPGLSNFIGNRFAQPLDTDSFPLVISTKLTLITQACGPKQMLTWVQFPMAWFLKFYWCSFRSASGHQKYI